MLKEARQANAVVSHMRFFTNDDNVVFPSFLVHLDKLLSIDAHCQPRSMLSGISGFMRRPYINAMPTIPSPTTTIFFLFSGGRGYCGASSSGSCPLTGNFPTCIPGEESAHDIVARCLASSQVCQPAFLIR